MSPAEDPLEGGAPWSAGKPTGASDTRREASLLATRLPPELGVFARIAYDLAWSWEPGGAGLFAALDPLRWEELGHNPVLLLLEASASQLATAARNRALLDRAEAFEARLAARHASPWREGAAASESRPVAFLCAEFGVHPSLPLYAGGLGILAGDLLREASDRDFPMVGIGLAYRQGSFHQRLDTAGLQHEYWVDRPHGLGPLALVTNGRGAARTVRVQIRGREVVFQIWRAQMARTSLYLLDADRPENQRIDRWITARLYESDREVRLAQYVALGLGGMRALHALGIEPATVHLNEGHAALAYFELVREGRVAGLDPDEAAAAARNRLVFTTHTPVAAGNESYSPEDLWEVAGNLPEACGLSARSLLGLGRIHPDHADEGFGLSALALRTCRKANGVSRIHGEVARKMWREIWPGCSIEGVPIAHVTNGVHLPTWMAGPMRALLERHLGADFARHASHPETWAGIDRIPDEQLWAIRCELNDELVGYVRDRSVADRLARGESAGYVEAAAQNFDPDVLTVGFARRLATYKRLHLLALDAGRALRLLGGERPMQLVVAGKAHPRDQEAKDLLAQLFGLRTAPEVGKRVVFLEDYDMATAARLVAGCDVWLNVPRPPLEASGTSGIKSALNGGLQLSVLDGWWAEAYDGENGWAIPADPARDPEAQDQRDSRLMYDLLEKEIVPLFYERDAAGIPRAWLKRVRASLKSIGPRFCATRMLEDYTRDVYRPND